MLKDIFFALIENKDRINFSVLIPDAINYLSGNDASFETVSSAQI